MKEAFFILLILLVIAVLTAIRYRKQIVGMIHIWRSLKTMRQEFKKPREPIASGAASAGPLVNCAKCGTWISEDRALRLGGRSYYCSAGCLERSASPP